MKKLDRWLSWRSGTETKAANKWRLGHFCLAAFAL
jgi:hypothetical protein